MENRFIVCCSALFELQQCTNPVVAKSPRENLVYVGNKLRVGRCRERVEADR